VLAYRRSGGEVEVLLVHPGGPFWRSRDRGAWQIPKGLIDAGEAPEATARREFAEELGIALTGPLTLLGTVRQTGGKLVDAFATEEPIHIDQVVSNSFTMEWPPASGRMATFPEVDAARWFAMSEAREWILPSQAPFLEWLASLLSG
jgi:predicted NUDIX family NTP pyrophosphohydrolase